MGPWKVRINCPVCLQQNLWWLWDESCFPLSSLCLQCTTGLLNFGCRLSEKAGELKKNFQCPHVPPKESSLISHVRDLVIDISKCYRIFYFYFCVFYCGNTNTEFIILTIFQCVSVTLRKFALCNHQKQNFFPYQNETLSPLNKR